MNKAIEILQAVDSVMNDNRCVTFQFKSKVNWLALVLSKHLEQDAMLELIEALKRVPTKR